MGLFLRGLVLLEGNPLENTYFGRRVAGRIVSPRVVDLRSEPPPIESLPSVDIFPREVPPGVQGVVVGIDT